MKLFIIKIFIIAFSTIFVTCQTFVAIRRKVPIDYKDIILSLASLSLCVICFILTSKLAWVALFITEINIIDYELRELFDF